MAKGLEDAIAMYLSRGDEGAAVQIPIWWLVGQENLKSAAEIFAIDPGIGSLLVYGEPGTGKTNALNSICALMPDVPVYSGCENMCSPLDGALCDSCARAKEKRLVNFPMKCYRAPMNYDANDPNWRTVVTNRIIDGARRGVVIFDPLNQFDPGLVIRVCQSSLPPTPRGRGRLSVIGAYDLLGDTLPMMLMSFTMGVRVEMRVDLEERTEIIRRSKEFASSAQKEAELEFKRECQRIRGARALLPKVEFSEAMAKRIDEICARFVSQLKFKFDVGQLTSQFSRVCRAYTAIQGKQYVTPAEVSESAKLVFTHRIEVLGITFSSA
jgi:Mg-chelatase subunit ChlI